MSEIYHTFINQSEEKSFDLRHRKTIAFNMGRYHAAVKRGKQQYNNLELARKQAAIKKHKSIENLESSLKTFELNFQKNGGKVFWAENANEANDHIAQILIKHGVKLVVKSKSMVTEELELYRFLQSKNIDCVETDLGEYIVQISDDKPYHIVTPVMHRSKEDIANIFHDKFGLSRESTPEEIAKYVRKKLRKKFEHAGGGITGANFLVSSTGSVGLTENEGNGILSSSIPRVQIVVAGIEKVIENIEDFHLFWPLLATFGTGQNVTTYNSIISGPAHKDEKDGPHYMYVILLDNGRTNLLSVTPQRRALSCIRCGSCLNGCPVYRNIGGHTYGTVYSGPIGAVITPHLKPTKDYKHLSYATSLCGKCTEVCPVNIPLHNYLLENRHYSVRSNLSPSQEKWGIKGWKMAMRNRWMIDLPGAPIKNYVMKKLFYSSWGKRRELPKMKVKTFKQLHEERKG